MTRHFTGYHMAAILIAFFGVVIAVNMMMATFAIRTFGGVVVENSYVASQNFNGWLKEARTENKLGWNPRLGIDESRRVTLSLGVSGAEVSGYAEHPLGRLPDVPLRFVATGTSYRAIGPLPAGRWTVHLLVRHGGDEARLVGKMS